MSGTHGVFQHRTGYFYTMLEEDFCDIYKAEDINEVCRAYITSILEHLTNKQYEATGSDEDIWVFMSLPEMARRMRHACSERTIHKEIQGMIKDGYLFKRRAYGKATMEYKLNLKKLRKALEALPEKQSCNSATYHLANLQDQSGNSARSTLQNYKNDLAELQPRIPIDIPIEETKITESTFGANAPARAHLKADIEETLKQRIDDTLEEVKRASEKLPVVKPDALEEEDTPTVKMGAVKIGASAHADIPVHSDLSSGHDRGGAGHDRDSLAPRLATSQQTIPKRPRGKKPVTPEPAPKFDLTSEQQHFWSLWCGVWFNQDIPPEITETAYKHVVKLAPHITTAELLNSLIEYARKDLQETQGIRRKAVQLGNCVNSYRGWKQVQREEPLPKPDAEIDEDYSDFDRYVGNGKEERAQLLREYEERLANGTLV